MKRHALFMLTIFLLQLVPLCAAAQSPENPENCRIALLIDKHPTQSQDLTLDGEGRLALPTGESLVRLSCTLDRQSVFSFDHEEILTLQLQPQNIVLQRLEATSPAFLLPAGEFIAQFSLTMHNSNNKVFRWQTLERFLHQSLLSSITMGGFYGLCIVLILYVSFMGRILSDKSFQLYSLYVFCAATFFLLQEGQLNIFLPEKSFLLDHQFYVLFAGLTVLSATLFISQISEIDKSWPKITRHGLYPSAACVLFIACYLLFAEHNALSSFLGMLMSRLTLLIMLAILLLVMLQAYRGVKMAWLVFISLLFMVIAMVIRVLPIDVGDFLGRYGLILAFAIEAFIFAIVVSSRIERIKIGRQRAENEANTDSLCDILNRRGWLSKAEDLRQLQQKKGGVLSLLYIDLNDFKVINDTHGHDCGDKVLIIMAKVIQHQARTKDVIGRIGGDEFVVVGHFDREQESQTVAARLSQRLRNITLQIDEDLSLNVSASVGHLTFTSVPDSVNEMLSLADSAMYTNKREHRSLHPLQA